MRHIVCVISLLIVSTCRHYTIAMLLISRLRLATALLRYPDGCRGARSILDLYIYIGPPRFICLAMECRLLWPTGAYTAASLVDWRSENGGQYAHAKTMGIIRFITSLFYFYPDFKWVPASNYRYCINEMCLSDGCRSSLPERKLRKFD